MWRWCKVGDVRCGGDVRWGGGVRCGGDVRWGGGVRCGVWDQEVGSRSEVSDRQNSCNTMMLLTH